MSDTENNNNHDKLEDARSASPLRLGRKRPASADLDTDMIEDDLNNRVGDRDTNLHFKQRHPSAEFTETDQRFDFRNEHHHGGRSDSPIKEELSLKDISMLRNPEESIKREKH